MLRARTVTVEIMYETIILAYLEKLRSRLIFLNLVAHRHKIIGQVGTEGQFPFEQIQDQVGRPLVWDDVRLVALSNQVNCLRKSRVIEPRRKATPEHPVSMEEMPEKASRLSNTYERCP